MTTQIASSSAAKALKPLSVDTARLAPRERFDFLNDIYAKERLTLGPRQSAKEEVSAGSTLWRVGAISFATTFSSGHIGRRVRSQGIPMLAVRQHTRGGCHSWSEDGHFLTRPGDYIVTLNSVDGVHACHRLETVNIALPVDMLDFDWRQLKTTHILRAETVAAKLLTVAIDDWQTKVRNLSPLHAEVLEREILGLVSYVLGQSLGAYGEPETLAQLRGKALREHINQHLMQGSVNVDELCKTFGLSRASIFREFRDEGGIQNYVTGLRLQKAMLLLKNDGMTPTRVSEVAAKIGYDDPFQFSRAFRKRFGFSPSMLLSVP